MATPDPLNRMEALTAWRLDRMENSD
jgi:hypothetical protein